MFGNVYWILLFMQQSNKNNILKKFCLLVLQGKDSNTAINASGWAIAKFIANQNGPKLAKFISNFT